MTPRSRLLFRQVIFVPGSIITLTKLLKLRGGHFLPPPGPRYLQKSPVQIGLGNFSRFSKLLKVFPKKIQLLKNFRKSCKMQLFYDYHSKMVLQLSSMYIIVGLFPNLNTKSGVLSNLKILNSTTFFFSRLIFQALLR